VIARFVEAAQGARGMNHGKFLLARLTPGEQRTPTALPGYEDQHLPLMTFGGLRRFHREFTLVLDLQTGEGATFTLDGTADNATYDLERHKIWICPLYEPFLRWLYDQRQWARGAGNLSDVPAYVELPDAPGAFAGRRRPGPEGEAA
jgi:hypothetical protein